MQHVVFHHGIERRVFSRHMFGIAHRDACTRAEPGYPPLGCSNGSGVQIETRHWGCAEAQENLDTCPLPATHLQDILPRQSPCGTDQAGGFWVRWIRHARRCLP